MTNVHNPTQTPFTPPPRILTHNYTALKHCRHGLFLYNLNDLFVGRALEIYGEWAETELDLLGPILRPGDVVLDVGANIGTHTVFFAQKVAPQGAVYAFELQRITHQYLCANVALNCLSNVHCLQAAAGAQTGTIRITLADPNQPQNFAAFAVQAHEQGEPVRLMRLDDLGLRKCRLLKIDVEGMEASVLEGAHQVLSQLRPVLFIENNNLKGAPDAVQAILDHDYTCWWHITLGYNSKNFFGNPVNIWEGGVPEANMICLPREWNATMEGAQAVTGPHDSYLAALHRAGIIDELPRHFKDNP